MKSKHKSNQIEEVRASKANQFYHVLSWEPVKEILILIVEYSFYLKSNITITNT